MNRKKLIDKILENWTAKVICFVLALLIYIFHQVTLLEKKTITVPLTVESNGVLTPTTELPRFVKVTVRSTADLIPTIYGSGIKAVLSLTEFTEKGFYDVPIRINLSEGLALTDPLEITVKPEVLTVNLDEKIMKYIPVEPAVSGKPEHGYTVKDISVSPSSVKVIGPSSIIEKTKFIYTKKVLVSGAAKSFSNDIKLDNIVSALQVFPESDFKVSVTVVPSDYEKTFENVSIKVLNLSDELTLENDIPAITFTLAGTMPVLEKFEFGENDIFIDCSEITVPGDYEVPLTVKTPASVAFINKPDKTVSIKVIEKPLPQVEEVLDQVQDEQVESELPHEEVTEEEKE